MTIEREFKDSGVAWLGSLPKGWEVVPLKQRTTLVSRGRSPDYSEDDQGVPILNQACIYWDGIRYGNVKWHRRSTLSGERGRLRHGDLLINSTGTGTLGRAAILDRGGEYVADSHVTVVRTTNEACASFLRYVLQTGVYQGYLYSVLAPGATNQIELSREGLRRTPFPMPEVDEQRSIVAFLDRKTDAIDTLIAKKERLIELLEEKRQALITQAVTRGLDPSVPLKDSGSPAIGRMPAHWTVKRLRHISPSQSVGVVVNPSNYYSDEGVPFLFGGNVRENRFLLESVRHISPESNRILRKSMLRADDLVTVRVGYPGVTAVIPPDLDGCNCASMMIIRRSPSFSSEWLCLAINSLVGRQQVEIVQYGAAQEQFNISHAVDFAFPFPPINEQREIARVAGERSRKGESIVLAIRRHIDRLREYRQALITAAVTGKIDVSKDVA